MSKPGELVFLAGKMGAGKSTLARQLARERHAVVLSEDEWLAALYPGQINSFDDYLELSAVLKRAIRQHIIGLLEAGTNVVLDFPANTVRQRTWLKALADEAGAGHELIYLKASDEHCLERIARRRTEQPERAAFDTESMFQRVTKYFEEPTEHEGLRICLME